MSYTRRTDLIVIGLLILKGYFLGGCHEKDLQKYFDYKTIKMI